jgi:hypothetical protein
MPTMWVFTPKSFLSIVEHPHEDDLLYVCARFKGDIEELFPQADVVEVPKADYRFRTSMSRDKVADAMARAVRTLDYGDVKTQVKDPDRRDAYIEVWQAMWQAQQGKD